MTICDEHMTNALQIRNKQIDYSQLESGLIKRQS